MSGRRVPKFGELLFMGTVVREPATLPASCWPLGSGIFVTLSTQTS
jgi:hypothetical protein